MTVTITKFNKYESGALYGFVDIAVPIWGTNLNIKGCKVFCKDGKHFLTMPSREYQDEAGEKKYAVIIGLDDNEVYKKMMTAMNDAWNLYYQANLGAVQPPPPNQEYISDDVPF